MTIRELREKHAALLLKRERILAIPTKENRTLSDPELAELETIAAEIKTLNTAIDEAMNARTMAKKTPVPAPAPVNQEPAQRNISIVSEARENVSIARVFREIANGNKSEYLNEINNRSRGERKDLDFAGGNGIALNLRASVTSTSGNSVQTDTLDILEPLENVTVFGALGARFMNNLTGNIKVPLLSGDFAATILGENESLVNKDFDVTSIIFKPRRLAFKMPVSFQMLAQDDVNLEAELKRQLSEAIGRGLENEAFKAGGTTKLAFEGFFKNAAHSTPVPLSWAEIVGMETGIKSKNVKGGLRYIMPSSTVGALKTTPKEAGYPAYLMEGANVNGYSYAETNALAENTAVLASWAYFRVCNWAAVEVIADPYTGFSDGFMYFGINAFADCGFDHTEAFTARTFGAGGGGTLAAKSAPKKD